MSLLRWHRTWKVFSKVRHEGRVTRDQQKRVVFASGQLSTSESFTHHIKIKKACASRLFYVFDYVIVNPKRVSI